MVKIKNREIPALCLDLGNARLILAAAPRGYVMCGYLNMQTAEKLGDIACIVTGVKTIEELLAKPVVALSERAKGIGIECGMSGASALEMMI